MTIYLLDTSPLIRDPDTRLNLEWLETPVCAGAGEAVWGFQFTILTINKWSRAVSGESVIIISIVSLYLSLSVVMRRMVAAG